MLETNKIYHGDCLEIMKEIPSCSIDMILTDIPYDAVSKNGEDRAKYSGQLRNVNKGAADILTFDIGNFLIECTRVCKGSIYIFCSIEQLEGIHTFFKYSNKKEWMARHCVWHKSNPSPSNGQYNYLNSFENFVFAKKRKTAFYGHCIHNVIQNPSGRAKVHPTQKPVKLFEQLLKNSTKESDIVLDPCLGSGTTAIACKNLSRNFIGIEKEQKYVEIANKRFLSVEPQLF